MYDWEDALMKVLQAIDLIHEIPETSHNEFESLLIDVQRTLTASIVIAAREADNEMS